MFLVGLTGGVATGKSTVASMFKQLGCPLIDADVEAREVVQPGKPAWRRIKEAFGNDFIKPDGSVDREKLGRVIFSDSNKRHLLNSITHPEIYKSMIWKLFGFFTKGYPYVILDLPLLFESGYMIKYLTRIIVVICDEDIQLKRVMDRGFSKREALQRIQAQLPLAEKCKQATHVIMNNGSLEETKYQVIAIYHSLYHSKSHWKVRLMLLATLVVVFLGTVCIWQMINLFY